jgi:hypothetical protein
LALRGYVVVAPVRPGYGATAIEISERGLFGLFFSGVGKCSDNEFRDAGLAVASIDKWIIEYMSTQSFIKRDEVIIVGQVCFKATQEAGSKMVCRTTMNGKWDTGQIAVRVDLIEREGDPVARLQIFVPPGSFLQPWHQIDC